MLGLHPSEHFQAIFEFAHSIADQFKRSYLLHDLVTHAAQRVGLFDFAEEVAGAIPIPYWRLKALNHVVAEMLRRDGEFRSIQGVNCALRERAERLLLEIESSLPSVSEEDGWKQSDLL
ncbi:MAG: hypothetical protein ABSG16_02485 [Candidatus Acidiferrum sp.]|jgi:hypothetical protein